MSLLNPTGFFEGLKQIFSRTQTRLGARFKQLLSRESDGDLPENFWDELEKLLIESDFGYTVTRQLIDALKTQPHLSRENALLALKDRIKEALLPVEHKGGGVNALLTDDAPLVILVVGVNGAGKTTQCAKLAHWFQNQNKKVLLAAGDTYRAAAVEQLRIWAQRLDTGVVAQPTGSDPASVAFDALQSAKAKNYDVLIIDTAGRLQDRTDLAQELKKVARVLKKLDPRAPHAVMLVLDGTLGQNAYSQVEWFQGITGLDSLLITKLDGSAKAGVVVGLSQKFQLPIHFLGSGEQLEDLTPFSADAFVESLFERS